MQNLIETKLKTLQPTYLEVIDESGMHSVPEGSGSHFKVLVVSPQFAGKNLVERHRMVNEILSEELKEKIHALSMKTWTPEEWKKKRGLLTDSPPCLGGSQRQ